jgi:hypothetical protein
MDGIEHWGAHTNACVHMRDRTVLLREVDGNLVDDLTGVSREGAVEAAVSVHDNEAKLLVVFEEFLEGFCVEAVVAEVEGCVDGLERLKVKVDLLLLALLGEDGTAVDDEAVLRHCEGGGECEEDRQGGARGCAAESPLL